MGRSIGRCYGLNALSPADRYVAILMTSMMALRGGAYRRCLGHEGGASKNEISALLKGTAGSSSYFHCVKLWWKDSFHKTMMYWCHHLGSRTMRKKHLLLVSHPVICMWLWPLERTEPGGNRSWHLGHSGLDWGELLGHLCFSPVDKWVWLCWPQGVKGVGSSTCWPRVGRLISWKYLRELL